MTTPADAPTAQTVGALHLPTLDGRWAHGWLAAVGLVRVLAERWPGIRLHWDPADGGAVITGGPATVEEAAGLALGLTIAKTPTGGVLPGCAPEWPAAGKTPGEPPAGSPWRALVTPAGQLHPLIRLHAAQTLRGVVDKARSALQADPDLMLSALTGLGLDDRYPAGLWLLRDTSERGCRASAGRDWLALMSLPWMPAEDVDGVPMAPGWVTPGTLEWSLWTWPSGVPAQMIPTMLAHGARLDGRDPVCRAWRRARTKLTRYDPPYLVPVPARRPQ